MDTNNGITKTIWNKQGDPKRKKNIVEWESKQYYFSIQIDFEWTRVM